MPNSETPDVRPGQVWADNDKRSAGRHVMVIAIEPGRPAEPHRTAVPAKAAVVLCTANGNKIDSRVTRIRVDRFRPTSTGYRLVKDAG